MLQFIEAREAHAAVDSAARHDVNAAANLWNVLTGAGKVTDKRADMVLETMPADLAAMLRTDEIAASYAVDRLWSAYSDGDLFGFDLREALRSGWAAFTSQANEVAHLEEGFGWDHSSAWQSYREIVGEDLDTAAVTRIAKLAARMYAAMTGGSPRMLPDMPGETYDVILGDKLPKLVLGEVMDIAMGGIPGDLALYRLVSATALQRRTRGEDNAAKGPLVLCRDESGSMHGPRHEWAAAAMIALSRVAKDEHRDVVVVHFSTSVVVQELDAGKAEDVAKLIKSHLSGGTDIARALRRASQEVTRLRADKGALADVILITDGVDPGEEVLDKAGKVIGNSIDLAVDAVLTEGRLWSVAIDCEIPVGNSLRDRASEYVHLSGKRGELTAEGALPLTKAVKS